MTGLPCPEPTITPALILEAEGCYGRDKPGWQFLRRQSLLPSGIQTLSMNFPNDYICHTGMRHFHFPSVNMEAETLHSSSQEPEFLFLFVARASPTPIWMETLVGPSHDKYTPQLHGEA